MQLTHLIQQHFQDLSEEWNVSCNIKIDKRDVITWYQTWRISKSYQPKPDAIIINADDSQLGMEVCEVNENVWYRIYLAHTPAISPGRTITIRTRQIGTIYDPVLFPNMSRAFELYIELMWMPNKHIHKKLIEWKDRKIKFRWER